MEWNDLLNQLSQGIEKDKLTDLKIKLVQGHFNRKAAGVFLIKESLVFEIIKYNGNHFQNRIIQTIFEEEQGQLIFELFVFCQRKNIAIPPIALNSATNCAMKNRSLAKYIIPIIGESGLQIISLFDQYSPLIPSKIKSYFTETHPKDSLAWFEYWVEINEIEAVDKALFPSFVINIPLSKTPCEVAAFSSSLLHETIKNEIETANKAIFLKVVLIFLI